MIIERIEHATEEDLEVTIETLGYDVFYVTLHDLEIDRMIDFGFRRTEERAKHYAEQLAGLIT